MVRTLVMIPLTTAEAKTNAGSVHMEPALAGTVDESMVRFSHRLKIDDL
jgi:hypothetical protein